MKLFGQQVAISIPLYSLKKAEVTTAPSMVREFLGMKLDKKKRFTALVQQ